MAKHEQKKMQQPRAEGERKKAKQTHGLKPTSVARVVKAGARPVISDVKLSSGSAAKAIVMAEDFLVDVAKEVCRILKLSKKKTATSDLLKAALETPALACQGVPASAARGGLKSKDRKTGSRHDIAVASAARVFSKGCPLGRGQNQMAEDAKDALPVIVERYLKSLGKDAALYAKNEGRVTVKTRDVESVAAQRS